MEGGTPFTIQEVKELAMSRLGKFPMEYYMRGSDEMQTMMDSEKAFRRYRLRPRILRNVVERDLSTSILGSPVDLPVGLAPTAMCGFAHAKKELATAEAASQHNAIMVLSCVSNTRADELAKAVPNGTLWMQMYLFKNRRLVQQLIRDVETSGYKALVVTVDSSGGANRRMSSTSSDAEAYAMNRSYKLANLDYTPETSIAKQNGDMNLWGYCIHQVTHSSSTIEDLKWLRSFTKLKIVLKGILTGTTARLAVQEGVADAIWISAHGGRQLDGVPAPIDAVTEVLDAVKGSGIEVYMDGGVRTGADVFKALALGIKAVFIGRPALWGLAVNGSEGVKNVLQILREELDETMAMCGWEGHMTRYPTPQHPHNCYLYINVSKHVWFGHFSGRSVKIYESNRTNSDYDVVKRCRNIQEITSSTLRHESCYMAKDEP